MKPGPLYGDNFQYLFSHAQQKPFMTGWESNQASCCHISCSYRKLAYSTMGFEHACCRIVTANSSKLLIITMLRGFPPVAT